jgi:creatinine amidohydrolase
MVTYELPLRLSDVTAAGFARAAGENPVILLSLGSHEDHGPHLPMGDFVLGDEMAMRMAQAARALGVSCFVAPTMPYGVADYFARSPGAMAVSAAVFKGLLTDLLSGLAAQGLTRLVILNGHGGNVPVIHEVSLAVREASGRVIPSLYLWKLARAMMQMRLGPEGVPRFGHGAEPLASLSAALRPDLVDFAVVPQVEPVPVLGLAVTGFGAVDFQGFAVDVPVGFELVPDDAIRAAAPLAAAALGAAVADELVAYGAAFIAHYAQVTG